MSGGFRTRPSRRVRSHARNNLNGGRLFDVSSLSPPTLELDLPRIEGAASTRSLVPLCPAR